MYGVTSTTTTPTFRSLEKQKFWSKLLKGRDGRRREVPTSLFVFGRQDETDIQISNAHPLYRLKGRWIQLPGLFLANKWIQLLGPLLALPCNSVSVLLCN